MRVQRGRKSRSSSQIAFRKEGQPAETLPDFKDPFGKFIVDIDVGGTFTDAIISQRNRVEFFKVDTTPDDLSQCIREVFVRAVTTLKVEDLRSLLNQVQIIRLSTSLTLNTLVERKGARLGLLLSKGWRTRFLRQPLSIDGSKPLILSDMVLDMGDSLNPPRHDYRRISEDEIRDKTRILLERGATILVLSLAGTEHSPESEYYVKEIIHKYFPRHFVGSIPVMLGSQVSSHSDYMVRTNTTLLNAYCHGALAQKLFRIEEFLRAHGGSVPFLAVHSSGGISRTAKTRPIHTISSGAAASMFGAESLARGYGRSYIMSLDIGGTSTEIGHIHSGAISYADQTKIEGLAVDLSSPVTCYLGLGGGSIVRLDGGGEIRIGPESAGSFPGPACYGNGGTAPTLTDAYLVLGYLDENYFLGGLKQITKEIARRAFSEKIARPLGITCEQAAFMAKMKAVGVIGNEILGLISGVKKAPSAYSLFATGGGGGCIGADVTECIGTGKTYIFRQGAVFGAFGSSSMDIAHTYEKKVNVPVFGPGVSREEICRTLNNAVLSLQRTAFKDMLGEGFRSEEIRFEIEAELNAGNSNRPVKILLPTPFIWPARGWPLLKAKAAEHLKGQGSDKTGLALMITKIVIRALADVPHCRLEYSPRSGSAKEPLKGRRLMYVGKNAFVEADVYEWDLLPVPTAISGPALIESPDTTIVVPPDRMIQFNENYNGVIIRAEKGDGNEGKNHRVP